MPKTPGYSIDNKHFFPTLKAVDAGYAASVKSIALRKKESELREYAQSYHGLQFSPQATLELMLRRLKLAGVVVPVEYGGQPETSPDPEAKKVSRKKMDAPSPGGFEGLFYDTTKIDEFQVFDEDEKHKDPNNGRFTTDGIHFFSTVRKLELWLKSKDKSKLVIDMERESGQRTPAFDRITLGARDRNNAPIDAIRLELDSHEMVGFPEWWTGFGEQETRPNSIDLPVDVPVTPISFDSRNSSKRSKRSSNRSHNGEDSKTSHMRARSRQGNQQGSSYRRTRLRSREMIRSRGDSRGRMLQSRGDSREQGWKNRGDSRGRMLQSRGDKRSTKYKRSTSTQRGDWGSSRAGSSRGSSDSKERDRQLKRREDLLPPGTPILRNIHSATVGDYALWDGNEEAHDAHEIEQELYRRFGDFSLLKIVNLSSCGINDKSMSAIAHILSLKKTGILQMDLSYNKLTGESGEEYVGFERFVSAISDRHCRLRALSLRGNKIYCEGARALAVALEQNCNLTELDISESLLATNMGTHDVDFSGLERIASALHRNFNLRHLVMETVYCETKTAFNIGQALVSTRNLHTFCGIPIKKALANDLRKLSLKKNIGNIGLFVAACLLQRTASFVVPIPCRLDTLRFPNVHITDRLVKEIATGLRLNAGLMVLDLTNAEKITDERLLLHHKRVETLCSALKENKGLTELKVGNHQFGDRGARAIASLISQKMGQSCSHHLVHESKLVSISLANNNISNVGAEALAESLRINRVMTHLDISCNRIADRGGVVQFLEALRRKNNLISLNLSSCLSSNLKVDAEKQMKEKELADMEDRADEEGKNEPKECYVPSEFKINALEGYEIDFSNRTEPMASNSSDSDWTSDDDEFNSSLVRQKESDLIVSLTQEEKADAAIALSIFCFENGPHGTLTNLDISNNGLGDTNMCIIMEALKTNATLTSLSIGGNGLSMSGEAIPLLIKVLSARTAMEHISLQGEKLGDRGAVIFSKFISRNNGKLRSLDLSNTDIGVSGGVALFSAISEAKYLKRLKLRNNKKITSGGNYLQRHIEKVLNADSFSYLDVENTGLSPQVVAVVKEYLKEKKGKTSLRIVGYGLEREYVKRPSLLSIGKEKLRCNFCEKYHGIQGFTKIKLSQLDVEDVQEMIQDSLDSKLCCLECQSKRDRLKKRALKPKKKYTIPLGASIGGDVLGHLRVLTRIVRPEACGTFTES